MFDLVFFGTSEVGMNEVLAVGNLMHNNMYAKAVFIHRHSKTAWAPRQKVMFSRSTQAAGCCQPQAMRHGPIMMYVSISATLNHD